MITYRLGSRIDSGNASAFEEDVRRFLEENAPEELVLDAEALNYISSAGLRILLRLKKKNQALRLIQVQPQVYEILEMTGFTEFLDAEKALRRVSIEGCPQIGQGAHGVVYRIAPDAIVKVYNEGTPMDSIRRERELARWAFVQGLPTAIAYDVVRVDERYGAVFELLNASSAADFIRNSPEHLEQFAERSVQLLKQIHAVEVEPGLLPDMKEQTLAWAEALKEQLPPALWEALRQRIDAVPDRHTLLHADYHLKNQMICGGELMLIDMDTLCTGDPVFELASLYNSYREFPSIDPASAAFLGIDVETARQLWERTLALYLPEADEAARRGVETQARILGCVRIIDYMARSGPPGIRERVTERCLSDLTALLGAD